MENRKVKIAIIDSGIYHTFEAFLCDGKEMEEFHDCNELKLQDTIIHKAEYFCKNAHFDQPRSTLPKFVDVLGHGTQVAAVAAGRRIETKLWDTFPLTFEGAAQNAEICSYKVVWRKEGGGIHEIGFDDIVDAFLRAIEDKVDVISVSLALKPEKSPYHLNGIAVGSFLAMQRNILTVAAAGNKGPALKSVRNVAPWILTVGASSSIKCFTSIKCFRTTVQVGELRIAGSSVNPLETEWHHLVAFPQVHTSSSYQAVAILGRILKEKIVLCDDLEQKKLAKSAGASGIIFQNEKSQPFAHDYDEVPSVGIKSKQAKKIHDEISKAKKKRGGQLEAKIYQSIMVDNEKHFNAAKFSGRGPNPVTNEILKPDLVAAGVDICVPHFANRGTTYTLKAGTSYACPFVAAKAALIKLEFEKKSLKPSPAWMHSALITTASHFEEMVDDSFAIGAGIVNSVEALDPGLIYDLKEEDHAKFLYGQGYNKELTEIFKCMIDIKTKIEAWELNYPSLTIAVPRGDTIYFKEIYRCVTHVGSTSCSYEAKVISRITTKGIIITVEPEILHFPVMNTSQQFKVVLRVDPEHWIPEVVTARLEWRGKEGDKQRIVKSPIVIVMKD